MSMEQLLDELDEIVYVSDPETYELLYINQAGERLLGVPLQPGQKCHEVFQCSAVPCEFCTNRFLAARGASGPFYVWEHHNAYLKRDYLLKDKLVDWNGRFARLELALDITQREHLSRRVSDRLAMQKSLSSCLRALSNDTGAGAGIRAVLRAAGEYYQADRAVLWKKENAGGYHEMVEWHPHGFAPLQGLDSALRAQLPVRWAALRRHCTPLTVTRDFPNGLLPTELDALEAAGIHEILAVPVLIQTRMDGFLLLDNPRRTAPDDSLAQSFSSLISELLLRDNLEAQLERMNCCDLLTTLGNRRAYDERLHRLAENMSDEESALGVAFIDLNGMKRINSTYGAQCGDRFLWETSVLLAERFHPENVYRVGGDEFAVLFPSKTQANFLEKLEKCKKLVANRNQYSISMGYAWSGRGRSVFELVSLAGEQLLLNKQQHYRKNMKIDYAHKPVLLNDLTAALGRGEFEVYLQAKIDMESRRLVGGEALIRHISSDGKITYPDQFILLLEREYIIRYIDFFVFHTVCEMLERWADEYEHPVPVSVNFSRLTLMEPDFINTLTSIQKKFRFPRELIEIEITESMDQMGGDSLRQLVEELRGCGFGVSLDDFGSKYTNLSLLAEMDVSIVKIDKSLVGSLETKKRGTIVVKSIVELFRKIGIPCVAEGVETARQFELLREIGCDYVQGFLFSHPIPIPAFEKIYRDEFSPRIAAQNLAPAQISDDTVASAR